MRGLGPCSLILHEWSLTSLYLVLKFFKIISHLIIFTYGKSWKFIIYLFIKHFLTFGWISFDNTVSLFQFEHTFETLRSRLKFRFCFHLLVLTKIPVPFIQGRNRSWSCKMLWSRPIPRFPEVQIFDSRVLQKMYLCTWVCTVILL